VIIKDYFRTKGINLLPEVFNPIINNSNSVFNTLIQELEVNLVTAGVYDGA
jgi:hypothetical protein